MLRAKITKIDAMLTELAALGADTQLARNRYLVKAEEAGALSSDRSLAIARSVECQTRATYIEAVCHLLDKVRDSYSKGVN